jgi:hypothetical protein
VNYSAELKVGFEFELFFSASDIWPLLHEILIVHSFTIQPKSTTTFPSQFTFYLGLGYSNTPLIQHGHFVYKRFVIMPP